MPKVPKISSLHVLPISPEKHGGEVDILPENEHKVFLHVDSITLGLHSQACPKYPKQVYNIFVIYQENREGWTWFFAYRYMSKVSSNCHIILGVCVTRHAKITQNNKFAISMQYLKKELSDEVDFLHADEHESLLRSDSMILMGMVQHSQSSQNSEFAMALQYFKKEVWDDVDFLHADKHQIFVKVYFNSMGIKVSYKVDIIIINGHDHALSNYSK